MPGDEVAFSPLTLMSEQEKRQAFSVASKGGGMGGEWSSDAIQAGVSPGEHSPSRRRTSGDGGQEGRRPGQEEARRRRSWRRGMARLPREVPEARRRGPRQDV